MKLRLRKYFQLKTERQSKKAKWITFILLVIIIAAAVLVVNQEKIHKKIYATVGVTLSNWVAKETEGLYTLEYDSLEINLLKKQISFKNIRYEIDSAILKQLKELPKNIYNITSPQLYLDIKSIWSVIIDDKLEFNGIEITTPSVTLINLSRPDSSKNVSLLSGDLYNKVNRYLDEFNITRFKLTDGKLNYKRLENGELRELKIDRINVFVDNFSINTVDKTAGTDRVRVLLKKPSFMLADDLHKLEMDSLLIDSKNERIVLSNVIIYPIYDKLQSADLQNVNIYNFSIPNIFLEKIDFTAAYRDNILDIGRIYIPNPEIIVDTHKKDSDIRTTTKNNLAIQLSLLFNKIHTAEFLLEDGKMDLALEANNKLQNIKFNNTTISISDFSLDTIKYSKQNSHIDFESFNLKLKDYQLLLPDSVHELYAESVEYFSDSSLLTIDNIQVTPKDKNLSRANRLSAEIRQVKLEGLNADRYIKEHQLELKEIIFSDPNITFNNMVGSDSAREVILNYKLNNNNIFSMVTSEKISINNLTLQVQEGTKKSLIIKKGNIGLYKFKLNQRIDPSRFFNSAEVALAIPDLFLQTNNGDEINLKNINASLVSTDISVGGLSYIPRNRSFEFFGRDVLIKGVKLKEALNGEEIIINSLNIGGADIRKTEFEKTQNIDKNKKAIPVSINHFNLAEGNLLLLNKESSIEILGINGFINNLKLSDKLLFDELKFYSGKTTFKSEAKNILATAAKTEIDKNNFIVFLPSINPMTEGREDFLILNATQAALLNYDLEKVINEGKLHAKELKLLSTNVELSKAKGSTEKKVTNRNRSLKIDWQKILQGKMEILLQKVIVSGEALSFDVNNGGIIETKDYEIELKDFNTNTDGNEHLLNSKNIRVTSRGLKYQNSDLVVRADNVAFDENRRLITINNFHLNNSTTSVLLPLIFAKKIDLKKLAEDNKIIGDELEIAGFTIKHKAGPKKNKEKESAESAELPSIAFRNVTAHQGIINFITDKGQEYKLNNITWNLSNFDIENNPDELLYSDNIKVKAGSMIGLINNEMDRLFIGEMTLTNSHLNIKNIFLKPEYGKKEYAYKVGHETDWINLQINDIDFYNVDIHNIADKFAVDKIAIGSLDASIYRDKKLPFPENRRPPLPQEALRNASKFINIDTVHIITSDITYQELSELGFEPGEIQFTNMDVLITNITNVPDQVKKRRKMTVKMSGAVEGTPIMTIASFDLASPKNEFTFSGKMDEGGLVKFNKIMENNVFLKIEKGHSKGLSFNMKANDNQAMGQMKFYYKNLKVSMIDKKSNKTSGLDVSLASFFANTFVINSSNPSFFVLKEGNIYLERDKSKSIFNYWAKSFLSGVVSSIGIKNNKKEIKEKMEEQRVNK